ncbi:unnamed protein product [Peniophora sp. CBMAI 1063]|nr:unnamed protein product [Peniophora sp. CBMAI 1063]
MMPNVSVLKIVTLPNVASGTFHPLFEALSTSAPYTSRPDGPPALPHLRAIELGDDVTSSQADVYSSLVDCYQSRLDSGCPPILMVAPVEYWNDSVALIELRGLVDMGTRSDLRRWSRTEDGQLVRVKTKLEKWDIMPSIHPIGAIL